MSLTRFDAPRTVMVKQVVRRQIRRVTGKTVRVFAIADLAGDDRYHVGDEAMFIADMDLFRHLCGRIEVTIMGPHAEHAARRYGAVPQSASGFANCTSDVEREKLLLELDNPDTELSRAIASSDVVVLAGGGNLSSAWPEHIYERALVVRRAVAADVPVILLGQTVGPYLSDTHSDVVAQILKSAQVVGARETNSEYLVRHLGADPATTVLQVDDAIFVDDARPTFPAGFDDSSGWLAVTIHPFCDPRDRVLTDLAQGITSWAGNAGLQVLYVPHCSAPEGPNASSDMDIAQSLMRAAGGFVLTPTPNAAGAAWAARHAAMVVSSRYHPVVFATSAAVPALGLSCDDYTQVKIAGALRHVGLENWCIGLDAFINEGPGVHLGQLHSHSHEVRAAMECSRPYLEQLHAARQSAVAAVLDRL